jgi:trehalose-phosphatase
MNRNDARQECFNISADHYDAVIFDLDGVVTRTARIHAAAWKEMFDNYLRKWAGNTAVRTFDLDADYKQYVDGKPRYAGVKAFLESRGINIPYGNRTDPAGEETICGLGNRKNEIFVEKLRRDGVETYPSTIELIHSIKLRRIKTAVVSSSKNCGAVLDAAGITELFDAKVDGVDSEELQLKGKPAPDIYLEAARRLAVEPKRALVVEDAIAGVEAGKNAGFGSVVGVARDGHPEALYEHGADIVVGDLSRVTVASPNGSTEGCHNLPSALVAFDRIIQRIGRKRLALFLDYDGTLTPIVDRPEQAVLSGEMRETLSQVAQHYTVAIISGRDLGNVREMVQLDSIYYAGSHGFEIAGPRDQSIQHNQGTEYLPVLDDAERELRNRLEGIRGARVERKKFSIAAHYRQVADADVQRFRSAVDETLNDHEQLRKSPGKKILELQPDIDWNKGKALQWLLDALGLAGEDVIPMYLGDDTTDEDAFNVLQRNGIGVLVGDGPPESKAQFGLKDPNQVAQFLKRLILMREHP